MFVCLASRNPYPYILNVNCLLSHKEEHLDDEVMRKTNEVGRMQDRLLCSHVPSGQADISAPFTSPTVSPGLHSIVTAKPSLLANRNRRVILFGSYLKDGLDFFEDEMIGVAGSTFVS